MIAICIYCLVDAEEVKTINNSTGTRIWIALFLIPKIIFTILKSILLIFHIFLWYTKQTTYSFLTRRKNERKQVRKQKLFVAEHRSVSSQMSRSQHSKYSPRYGHREKSESSRCQSRDMHMREDSSVHNNTHRDISDENIPDR